MKTVRGYSEIEATSSWTDSKWSYVAASQMHYHAGSAAYYISAMDTASRTRRAIKLRLDILNTNDVINPNSPILILADSGEVMGIGLNYQTYNYIIELQTRRVSFSFVCVAKHQRFEITYPDYVGPEDSFGDLFPHFSYKLRCTLHP